MTQAEEGVVYASVRCRLRCCSADGERIGAGGRGEGT
jgi:hypothetical protein